MVKRFFGYVRGRIAADKIVAAVILIYIAFCFCSGIYFAVLGQVRNSAMSWAFLLAAPVVYLVEYWLRLKFVPFFMAILLFLISGSILGSCYDLYTIIPCFDEILHGISGVVFGLFGFALMETVIGKGEGNKNFFICLIVGLLFSLSIALLWEMFEYASYAFFGIDMQEDMIIDGFSSYLLAGSHNETVVINGITQTVITFANGEQWVIEGYLDVGLFDTLNDMLVCLIGGIVYIAVLAIDRKLGGKAGKWLIPGTRAFERKKNASEKKGINQ